VGVWELRVIITQLVQAQVHSAFIMTAAAKVKPSVMLEQTHLTRKAYRANCHLPVDSSVRARTGPESALLDA